LALCNFCLILSIIFSFVYSSWALKFYSQSYPDKKIDSLIAKGISFIVNGKYKKAEEIFITVKSEYPNLPIGDIYLAANLIAKSEDLVEPLENDQIISFFENAEKISKRNLEKNPDDLWIKYFEALRIGYYSYYLGVKKSYIKAFDKAIKAKNLFQEIYKNNPNFYEALFAIGSYKYWKSSKLSFLTWTPLLDDEKEEGLRMLEEGALKSNYNFYLAAYSLFWAYLDSKKFEKAKEISEQMISRWKESRFFMEIRARALEEFDLELAAKYYYEIIESLRKESLLTPINELYYLHKVARTYFKVKQVNKAREIVERSLRIENKFEDKKRLELFEAQRKKFLKLKNEIQEYEKQNK